jgi:hypothetical protein
VVRNLRQGCGIPCSHFICVFVFSASHFRNQSFSRNSLLPYHSLALTQSDLLGRLQIEVNLSMMLSRKKGAGAGGGGGQGRWGA